ncbi:MAG: alpha/beta family hydrolase [bacterium]
MQPNPANESTEVLVDAAGAALKGDLAIPGGAEAFVLFAHGSGSSRLSPRNRLVAAGLNDAGLATLLFDLLTAAEESRDLRTREFRFDIGLLAARLTGAVDWAGRSDRVRGMPIGLFGSSTGAAAALIAAARRPAAARAVVSRGGRPDLAGEALPQVEAPTLLLVGGEDRVVIELNRRAAEAMQAPNRVEIVPGATHLFEEPGKLEEVIRLAGHWFTEHLK